MGKGSRVRPLSRRAPEAEALTALAGSSPEDDNAGTDVQREERSERQPASFEVPASLPQRVRGGSDGPHPPARVTRRVLPDSFVERVRAAAQAEAAKSEEEPASPDRPAHAASAFTWQAAGDASREAPADEAPSPAAPTGSPAGLPQRVRGAGDGPRPPARVARPKLPESLLERVRAAMEANAAAEAEAGTGTETQDRRPEAAPIPLPRRDPGNSGGPRPPVQAAQPEPVTPGDAVTEPIPVVSIAPASTPDLAADQVSAPPENAAPAESGTAEALPEGGPDDGRAQSKAAVVPVKPRPAPSTHARTTPRVQRAGAGTAKPLKRQARASRSYRMAGVLTAGVVLAAVAVGFAVFHHTGGNSATGSTAGRSGGARSGAANARPADAAELSRNAAAWVAAQVGSASIISCDPVMCQALKSSGLPAGQLLVLKQGITSPLGSAIIVATPVLRSQIGSRLGSVYAPGILARFGSGSQQIEVRAVAAHGPADYMARAKADLAARKLSGSQLAGNSRVVVSGTARKELAAGEVDARLMTVITGLAASHPVDIVAFGEAGPNTATAPFRSAELAESNMQTMVATVTGLQPPFRAAHMASLKLSTGRSVLSIDFTAPSIFGLLGSNPASGG